jgi:hypothetical protein
MSYCTSREFPPVRLAAEQDDPGLISASAWKPRFEHAFTRNAQQE